MFELSVATKYLIPKWRQLSVSIISLISILVIAVVVWLIVVFFSVTNGLEKSWVHKLVALTAPVRITPTDSYYNSYYYLIDSISEASDYSLKSIGEKKSAPLSDPYDPSFDEEIPSFWPKGDRNKAGELKDPVKIAFETVDSIKGIPGLRAKDFEMTGGNLHLELVRYQPVQNLRIIPFSQQYSSAVLSQNAYLGSFDGENSLLTKNILPLTANDATNLLSMLDIAKDTNANEDSALTPTSETILREHLKAYFSNITIRQLSTPSSTWIIPKTLWPEKGKISGWAVYKNEKLLRIVLPTQSNQLPDSVKEYENQGYIVSKIQLEFRDKEPFLLINSEDPQPLPRSIALALAENFTLDATLDTSSLEKAHRSRDILFNVKLKVQGVAFEGTTPLKNLVISKFDIPSTPNPDNEYAPLWFNSPSDSRPSSLTLPSDPVYGEGALFPRTYREAGVAVGDRGYISYAAPTASSVQEQRTPIFVAGFYEPGVIPTGGRIILVNQEITSLIRSSMNQSETNLTNGINVRFDALNQANEVKTLIEKAFEDKGIRAYWKVETFRDYEFTKDILKQLQSEKNLFTLLAGLIILVACSNIISMLIILVNDKKMEIGILRSMGASSLSIAIIFGTCGIIMGMIGSVLGILAAIATLKNLSLIVGVISSLQGYEMFNPLYFGDSLPTELSFEALTFVIIATSLLSLIAGLVPAIKASLMRPSAILRSE